MTVIASLACLRRLSSSIKDIVTAGFLRRPEDHESREQACRSAGRSTGAPSRQDSAASEPRPSDAWATPRSTSTPSDIGASSSESSSSTRQRTLTIIVKFDEEKKVRDFAYNYTQF